MDPSDLSSTEFCKEITFLRLTERLGNEKPLEYGGKSNQHHPVQEVLVWRS
jgi:hypothetical protein